jgi:nucleoside-diphosphate-sugar epimerase
VRILLTGGEGYLGALMGHALLARGHDVQVVDTCFYDSRSLVRAEPRSPAVRRCDVRDLELGDLEGFDAVVHLAELSNDPLGDLAPDLTERVNLLGTTRLAERAKAAGVRRFVHMSSCSVYGVADDEVVDESSPVNPLTEYARCKVEVERAVGALADDGFAPTFLRNATAYGLSPRMRFDLVVNNLAGVAHTTRRIVMTSDGTPWRPLVHARDIARAVGCVLDAPDDVVRGEILNVGSNDQNHQVRDIAGIVGDVFTGCEVSFGPPSGDDRSYRVSFDKIRRVLPDFRCEWDVRGGVEELHAAFARIGLDEATFRGRPWTRLDQIQWLLDHELVDDDLRWT